MQPRVRGLAVSPNLLAQLPTGHGKQVFCTDAVRHVYPTQEEPQVGGAVRLDQVLELLQLRGYLPYGALQEHVGQRPATEGQPLTHRDLLPATDHVLLARFRTDAFLGSPWQQRGAVECGGHDDWSSSILVRQPARARWQVSLHGNCCWAWRVHLGRCRLQTNRRKLDEQPMSMKAHRYSRVRYTCS